MRFQLLNGRHIGADPANPGVDRTYDPGDVIETNVDLIAACDPCGHQGVPKFLRLADEAPSKEKS